DPRLAEELARIVARNGSRRIELQTGMVKDLAAERQFDCILYIDVLEHILDDRGELQRASRFLAQGGYLVVLSPAFQFLYSPFDKALGHERRYTIRTLSEAFPTGLARERVFYADSVGALASLSNRLLLRSQLPTRAQILLWDRAMIPVSRVLDGAAHRWFGRSVIGVYSRPRETVASRASPI
ncbi:MAG: methyltransferase domain-containing protein, partial [Gemmatimonadaceae bacterium]